MAQKKFLVTGATGDTGGYTVEQLVERGHAVRALAHREDDRSKRLEKMGAEVVIGDFLKFNDVRGDARSSRRILLLSDPPRHSAGDSLFRSGR
jgi:NAD(P)H dehydrogenase (quinone)